MRRRRLFQLGTLLSVSGALASAALPACSSASDDAVEAAVDAPPLSPTGAGGWSGGGGTWAGSAAQWGGGGGMWAGGGGWWAGGGGQWAGGGGKWAGGGGQWAGGGGWWAGGGGWWAGGGGLWAGGGGKWAGGGGKWAGGGGLWAGGYATATPFVGWSYARHWNFRGVPQPAPYDPTTPPAISGTQDATACAAGAARLGGFAYPVDADGWGSAVALGYHAKLCLPTPGGGGLSMNSTIQTPSIAIAGGYDLTTNLTNAANDAVAIKGMVGFGQANVAHQYSGALCASIGSLAAAKRSCAVGIAFTDVNTKINGDRTQRGVNVLAAQNNSASFRTPFGQADGHGLYGNAPEEVLSYAGHTTLKHASITVPTSASAIPDWNATNNAASLPYTASNFAAVAMSASPNAQKLVDDANRSVGATASPAINTLNMIPKDYGQTLLSDAQKSVPANPGEVYLLSLHSLATQQNPLYGSGGGRWFFTNSTTRPLLEPSSVFQSSTYLLTGRLTGTPAASSLKGSLITPLELRYADWRAEPSSGTLYIDKAGQYPATLTSDADREARIAAALVVPPPDATVGAGDYHSCALDRGGNVQCWGSNTAGQLGDGTKIARLTPTPVVGLGGKATSLTGSSNNTCALLESGEVKCWGWNYFGAIGDNTTTDRLTPVKVVGLAGKVTSLKAGGTFVCALLQSGDVQCWGRNYEGQLGNGTASTSGPPYAKLTPVTVVGLGGKVTGLAPGGQHNCALLESGQVKCWGGNARGQLGDGTTTSSLTPRAVVGLAGKVTSITAGPSHTCALLQSGQVQCWGENMYGQLGNGTISPSGSPVYTERTPVSVVGLGGKVKSLTAGIYHTCALLQSGQAQCWGRNDSSQLGAATSQSCSALPCSTTAVTVTGLQADKVLSIHSQLNSNSTCLRTLTGNVKCWGLNANGQLGDGTTVARQTPVTSASPSNAGRVSSQGSVLVHLEAIGGTVSGHVTPIPWSMTKTSTGTQALMVTYDPLAAAAAVFIEQYQAHINACKATTSESMTEDNERLGQKLWACSNATGKSNYLSGMQTMLNGARAYLFGTDAAGTTFGCLQGGATGDGTTCASTTINTNAHLPYTAVVPAYTSWDTTYRTQVQTAVSDYKTRLLASNGSRLEKTLQLMGTRSFTTDDAIVSSRVQRLASYGSQTDPTGTYDQLGCVDAEGFTAQGVLASCGDGVCAKGQETATSCPRDCN